LNHCDFFPVTFFPSTNFVSLSDWQIYIMTFFPVTFCLVTFLHSINHVFKKAVEWTPQPIPKLTTKLLNVVRIQHVDLKRSLYGTGNYELCERYKRHSVSHQHWFSKTLEQREGLFQKLLNDHAPLVTAVKSTCSDFEVPKPQKLAKKLHQNKRPRTNRTQPRY
jgi:hypothetical protein